MTQIAEPTNLANRRNGEIQQTEPPRRGIVVDAGQFANLLDSGKFEHLWRVAQLFAASAMVPAAFQKKPEDCFIGLQMAMRLGVDPFMFLQSIYVVHGKPGMEAKLAIALINSSGTFKDPLDFEIEGTDPASANYRVRAYAVRASTEKRVDGPWVDWKMVKAEGWDTKPGSKWKTIPALMFQYRAASWFGKLQCPERLMGMQTRDELEDSGAGAVMPVVSQRGVKSLLTKIENVTKRPVSEGHTFVPEPDALAAAQAERPTIQDTPTAGDGGTVDAPSRGAPAPDSEAPEHVPADSEVNAELVRLHEALDDADDAKKNLLARARAVTGQHVSKAVFEGALFKALHSRGVGAFEKSTFEQRLELWREIDAGTFPTSEKTGALQL